jgi:hypothetical protein
MVLVFLEGIERLFTKRDFEEAEMNTTSKSEKLEKTLTALRRNLQESWEYFSTIVILGNPNTNKRLEPIEVARFFDLTLHACIRSSFSTLAELISKNKDSVNLKYLLNMAENSPTLFKFVEKQDLTSSIQKHKDWLEELTANGAVGQRIIDKRDKIIAHTDRKFATERKVGFLITNPALNSEEIKEVEEVYKQLVQIINTYDRYYYGPSLKENELDMTARDDLQYMLHLVEKRDTV